MLRGCSWSGDRVGFRAPRSTPKACREVGLDPIQLPPILSAPCTSRSPHLRHVPGLVAVAGPGEDSRPDVLPAPRGRILQPAEQAVGALPGLGEDDAPRRPLGLEVLPQDLLQLAQPGVLVELAPSERQQARPVLCAGKRGVRGAPCPQNQPAPTLLQLPPGPFFYPQRWWPGSARWGPSCPSPWHRTSGGTRRHRPCAPCR